VGTPCFDILPQYLARETKKNDKLQSRQMRFEVHTATRMKMTVFWDVAQCSLIDIDRRFRGAYCLTHGALNTLLMEAVSFSETSVSIHQTIRCNIPDDSHLQSGLSRPRFELRTPNCKSESLPLEPTYSVKMRT
jgi:hypothetical protein